MDAQLGALAQRPTGRVHSIFENGINLAMGDALIFVGTTKNGRLPFGIHMGQDSVKGCADMFGSMTPSWLRGRTRFAFSIQAVR